jgi:hypothetical protein
MAGNSSWPGRIVAGSGNGAWHREKYQKRMDYEDDPVGQAKGRIEYAATQCPSTLPAGSERDRIVRAYVKATCEPTEKALKLERKGKIAEAQARYDEAWQVENSLYVRYQFHTLLNAR